MLLLAQAEQELGNTFEMVKATPLSGWQYLLYIVLSLLPAIALMAFILWRDRLRPEPAKELILAFVFGLLSIPLSVLFSTLLASVGLYSDPAHNVKEAWQVAFFGAAFPEELGKLIIIWLFFRWRRRHDEFMDGIVYAVCVGLAFATAENIKYVLTAIDYQSIVKMPIALATSVTRALTAVPGHFGFAVLMGFFFSLYLYAPKRKALMLLLAYIVPVIFHGLYDFFAFSESLTMLWTNVISFAFFLVFFLMNNLCVKVIRTAKKIDDDAYAKVASDNAS